MSYILLTFFTTFLFSTLVFYSLVVSDCVYGSVKVFLGLSWKSLIIILVTLCFHLLTQFVVYFCQFFLQSFTFCLYFINGPYIVSLPSPFILSRQFAIPLILLLQIGRRSVSESFSFTPLTSSPV